VQHFQNVILNLHCAKKEKKNPLPPGRSAFAAVARRAGWLLWVSGMGDTI